MELKVRMDALTLDGHGDHDGGDTLHRECFRQSLLQDYAPVVSGRRLQGDMHYDLVRDRTYGA